MAAQYIVNDKGEKTGVILPIGEYEDMMHHHQFDLELTDGYRAMIDELLDEDEKGDAKYVSYDHIKDRFLKK